MNHTTDNTTLLSCDFAYLPINPAKVSPDRPVVFFVRIVVNALTCPFIILLNILVLVAVKTKRQLRTKSNVALACLATTDLVLGLFIRNRRPPRHPYLKSTDISRTIWRHSAVSFSR